MTGSSSGQICLTVLAISIKPLSNPSPPTTSIVPLRANDVSALLYSAGSDNPIVIIDYGYNATSSNWTQVVTNGQTGAELSYFSHPAGLMTGWGTSTECNDNCTGIVAKQQYLNTTITLASADPDFGATLGISQGTIYTGLTSEQGGLIGKIAEISVPSMS
ncbi:hypothetical protein BPOR_0014g00420 [Botrytis porri]|uniref:Uncharacterized protein n=1 Tax=Botrytis porri TaxID=87229 RepID=A0A4Z1L5B0_9HELO|nr:hypothetical protein BPOR_0014g00420 [Botrytis porri]